MKQSLVQYVTKSDIGFFQWIKNQPHALERFSASMAANVRLSQMEIQAALCSLFPNYEAQESKDHSSGEEDVLLIDVGGGRGQALADLRRARPDLRGRFIVQDLPQEIEGRDESDGIEAMPHDFFTPQPVRGRTKFFRSPFVLPKFAETAQSHRFRHRLV